MRIANKIALVTGGANGIGFASAVELLKNGAAHVAILDLANSNGGEAARKLNDEFGQGKAIFVICDVTNLQEFEAGFAKTVSEFGGLDIVINNAGILDELQWEKMVDTNYNGVVRGSLLGLRHMARNKGGTGGTIVNVASITGLIPINSFPIYAGTKHAVVGFSRSLATPYHYGRTGVRMLTICPSTTNTRLAIENTSRVLEDIGQEAYVEDLKVIPMQSCRRIFVPTGRTVGNGDADYFCGTNLTHCLTIIRRVDIVVKGIMHVIENGETGSVWVVEKEEPIYQVDNPAHPMRKIPSKHQH